MTMRLKSYILTLWLYPFFRLSRGRKEQCKYAKSYEGKSSMRNVPGSNCIGRQCHRLKTYEVGEFVYWDKGPGIAVFYRQGNNEISAGIIRMGYIESGIELFETPNDIEVKFELIVE